MRKNQKGFTLVELIIAVAILAIVTAAVCGFIVVGSRSYASSNTDIMLQQDAQLALNQISDVIIDTTDSISYGVRANGSGDMQMVLKDSEFGGEATEKCLIVVNRDEADSNNHNPSYWFYWSKEQEKIYFNEVDASSSTMDQDQIEEKFKDAETNKAILAQHVTDFSIDISQFEANRVVMISMTFENGNRTYSTSNNVTVRNRIALNEITVGPMKRAEDFEINVVKNITMEPGETIDLIASNIVEVVTPGDKELTWELIGSPTSSTLSNGVLSVGIGETSQNYNIKVSRANEQYEGQNERVAQTIKVNIKRATFVDFTGPSTAKKGDTIELSAHAGDRNGLLGNKLCVGHGQIEATLPSDKDVDNWTVVSGDAQIVSQGNGKATIKILDNAAAGSKIVIRADSALSKTSGRAYGLLDTPTVPPVWSEHVITVEQSQESSAIPLGSALVYGSDNAGNHMTYDFIRETMPDGVEYTKVGKYVFCIRVREENDPNWHSPDDDWYFVYLTSAANMRFAPDLFGLDMTKSYKVYLQALIPMPKDIFNDLHAFNDRNKPDEDGKEAEWWDDYDDIWTEYSTHLNYEGKYTGNLYYATELYYAELNPPIVRLDFEQKTYPYEDKSYQEVISFLGGGKTGLGRPSLNEAVNIDKNTVLNNFAYTIYKEDESGQWHRIYGPSFDKDETVALRSGLEKIGNTGLKAPQKDASIEFPSLTQEKNYSGDNKLGTHELQPTASTFLNYNNPNGDKSKAIGKYHIVPGYLYKNNPVMRLGEYDEKDIIRKKTDNYWDLYYYKDWDCVMNFEIRTGLTLQLPDDTVPAIYWDIYSNPQAWVDDGYERWTTFPLPSDSDFPFTPQSSTPQTISRRLKIYSKKSAELTTNELLSEKFQTLRDHDATLTCKYDSATGKYTLTVATEIVDGRTIKTHVYGEYIWLPGYSIWERFNPQEYEYETTINTNMEITIDGVTYETYFPSPSDGSLTFEDKEKTSYYRLRLFKKGSSENINKDVTVKYQMVNGSYRITLTSTDTVGRKKTTYTYGPLTWSNNKWGSCTEKKEEEALWDWNSLAEFEWQNQWYKTELDNPPKETPYTVKSPMIYKKDDTYGEWGENQGGVAIDYTYDSSIGAYTARFRNGWWDGDPTSYAIYSYNTSTKKWEKIQ